MAIRVNEKVVVTDARGVEATSLKVKLLQYPSSDSVLTDGHVLTYDGTNILKFKEAAPKVSLTGGNGITVTGTDDFTIVADIGAGLDFDSNGKIITDIAGILDYKGRIDLTDASTIPDTSGLNDADAFINSGEGAIVSGWNDVIDQDVTSVSSNVLDTVVWNDVAGKFDYFPADDAPVPTLQNVTDAGSHTTNGITLGGDNAAAAKIQLNAAGSATFADNVGIGTTSTVERLVVKGSAPAGYVAQFTDSSESNNAKIYVDSNGIGFVKDSFDDGIEFASDTARIYVNGSQRLRIDSSGNTLIGGTLPAAPNISLNADGSATFASGTAGISAGGLIFTGDLNTTQDVSGFTVSGGGLLRIQRKTADTGSANLLEGYFGLNNTSSIKADGSATFAGAIRVNRAASDNTVIYGQLNGTTTSEITSNGAATFAGNITTPRVLAIGPTANDKVWSGYLTNTNGAATSFINGDGSATFAGRVQATGYALANLPKLGDLA